MPALLAIAQTLCFMLKMKRLTKKGILLILSGLTLLISGISVLFLISGFIYSNWIVSFSFTNNTDSTIEITPVGIWHSSEKLGPLPLSIGENPSWPTLRRTNFKLTKGDSRTFFFDYDDINMDGIVIKQDDFYGYYPVLLGFEKDAFFLKSLKHLEPATPEMIESTDSGNNWKLWTFLLIGLINIPLFIGLLRSYLREKSKKRHANIGYT